MRHVVRPLVLLGVLTALAACGPGPTVPPASPSPSPSPSAAVVADRTDLAFPFAAGTDISIGARGLHPDNFGSVEGGSLGVATIDDASSVKASIDLLAAADTRVLAVADGTIRSAWAGCDLVVVDHGDGLWSSYLHIAMATGLVPGAPVERGDVLGTVRPQPAPGTTLPCGEHSDRAHLHFSLARATSTSHAAWTPLAGWELCGHRIESDGSIDGLGTVNGPTFPVPDCGQTIALASPPFDLASPTSDAGSAQLTSPSPKASSATKASPTPTAKATPKPTANPTATLKPTPTPALTAPTKPTGLSVSAADSTTFSVGWHGSAGATDYLLSDNIDVIHTGTSTHATWSVTPGTYKCFHVAAANAAGQSDWTGFECATTPGVNTAPPAPGNVRATALSSSEIRLTWSPSAGADGYRIQRWNGVSWGVIANGLAASATSYTDSGLAPDSGYSYGVCAHNSGGETCADAVSATTNSP